MRISDQDETQLRTRPAVRKSVDSTFRFQATWAV